MVRGDLSTLDCLVDVNSLLVSPTPLAHFYGSLAGMHLRDFLLDAVIEAEHGIHSRIQA